MDIHEFADLVRRSESAEQIDLHRGEILGLFPKAGIMLDFDQLNHAHQYNLWEHSLHVALGLPKDIDDDLLYAAALLHDIGKPDCQCRGKNPEDTNMHYYGHPLHSMEIVRDDIIPALEQKGIFLSKEEKRRILYYVEYHDDRVSLRIKHLRRHLKMAAFAEFQKLMLLQISDAKAHKMMPIIEERIKITTAWAGEYGRQKYEEIKAGK